MYFDHYLKELGYPNIPDFLNKYLEAPCLKRLKKIGYFCGMDYASKDVYNFREYISRFDHSLTVSLIVYKLTGNKVASLAGLFHDVATPCFSHVIDYMNKDYEKQESTEEYTEDILINDAYLNKCLKEDKIDIKDITNYKEYPVVDNDRPKVCADRIDGLILTGIGWTKNLSKKDISRIVKDLCIFTNEYDEDEIGFKTLSVAKKVLEVSKTIDIYCHSNEDNYMMELLAKITKLAINNGYISYRELYILNEEDIFNKMKNCDSSEIQDLITEFETIKKKNIPLITLPKIKTRDLNPIVQNVRIKSINNML